MRASTRWMMLSVRSCSPQEMKILRALDLEVLPCRHGRGFGSAPGWTRRSARSGTWCRPRCRRTSSGTKRFFSSSAAEALDQVGGTVGQAGGHVERLAGAVHQVVDDDAHHVGKPLPAVLRVAGRRRPAVTAVLAEGVAEFGGQETRPFSNLTPAFSPMSLSGSTTPRAKWIASVTSRSRVFSFRSR